MKIMVTGSRDWRDIQVISDALTETTEWRWWDHVLFQGCASGADAIARSIATHYVMPVKDFWPDYVKYEFAEANKRRNIEMVESRPDIVLAFPTARSRGTWHAVNAAKAANIEVQIFEESR